jgi:Na+/H+ antiporter NhaC
VTTWIGAELSYIQDGINVIGLNESAYGIFLNSLMYSFYPVFALALILILIFRKVDFGPMLKAERTARRIGVAEIHLTTASRNTDMESAEGVPARWYNAVVPVFVIVAGTFSGLLYTGWDASVWADGSIGFAGKLSQTIGQSDSYKALLWSSLGGVISAVILTVSQKLLNLRDSIEGLMIGFRTMLTAVLILTLAWSIALVTEHMHTAEFISRSMLELSISPYIVPVITFILAALVAFSTGSSWGTMAILYPLLLPSAWLITNESGFDYQQSMAIFYNVVSAVLAGSVLGDHCSPISDTTILSSLASSCNHIEHVRTQLPYAITAGMVATFIGTLPAAYGVHPGFLFPAGVILLLIITYIFGRKA